MSRWRQSLCGKSLQNHELTSEGINLLKGKPPLSISCGGGYYARPLSQNNPKPQSPTLLFLAKKNYEVIVCKSRQESDFSGFEAPSDDLEVLQQALSEAQSKPIK